MSGYFVARLPDVAKAFLHDLPDDVTVSIDASALVLDAQQRMDLLQVAASCQVFLANRVELAAVTAPRDTDPALAALHEDRPHATMNLEVSMEEMRSQAGFDGVMVVKDGPNGAHATQQGPWLHVPARDVVAVDTTGAGDAFTRRLSRRVDLLGGASPVRQHRSATAPGFGRGHGFGGAGRHPKRRQPRLADVCAPGENSWETLCGTHAPRVTPDRKQQAPVDKGLSLVTQAQARAQQCER